MGEDVYLRKYAGLLSRAENRDQSRSGAASPVGSPSLGETKCLKRPFFFFVGLENKIQVSEKPKKNPRSVQPLKTICWPSCRGFPCHKAQESVWAKC